MAEIRPPQQKGEESIEDKFMVPYQQNLYFTGREVFLQTLKDKLFVQHSGHHIHRVALYGMGGIGKTQVALGYAYAFRTSYERVYWVRAVNRSSLLLGYQNIAKEVHLPIPASSSPDDTAKRVLVWLRQTTSWLLIIDNLDDISVIESLLPENGPTEHTIITTRNPNSAGIPAEGLEVPLLDHMDAISLLSNLSGIVVTPGSPEFSQADEIVKELGYLPLAIEQAAAFVREVTGDFAAYREEYQQNHKDLYRWVPQGNRPYRDSVATTWSMSFEIVRKNHEPAASLLQLLSFLNPDGILIDFLRDGAKALPIELENMISSSIKLATALLELEKFSLVKWDRRGRILVTHRLVQVVIKDEMSDQERASRFTSVIELCYKAFPQDMLSDEARNLRRRYINQVLAPLQSRNVVHTEELAYLHMVIGQSLRDVGNYKDSENHFLQAIDVLKEINGEEAASTIEAMHSLAITYFDQGRLKIARELLEKVTEISKKINGEDHRRTLTATYHLLRVYLAQGLVSTVASSAAELIEKGKRVLGLDHLTLSTMNLLASAYQKEGRLAEATELYEQVLQNEITASQGKESNTLSNMADLVSIYRDQGRIDDAKKLEKEMLEKAVELLGENHPHTLTIMHNFAAGCYGQKDYEKAISIGEKVLTKRLEILGPEHYETIKTMHNLALAYYKHGDMEKGDELSNKLFESAKLAGSEPHPQIIECMTSLVGVYGVQGREDKADETKKKIQELLGKNLFETE